MKALQIAILLMAGTTGALTVFVRTPQHQLIVLSLFGLILALMFAIFQAPDVALSQLAVGTVAIPLMILLTLVELRRDDEADEKGDAEEREK
jgi:uncharacterized MnhB-related membrane protein